MLHTIQLTLAPRDAYDQQRLLEAAAEALSLEPARISGLRLRKRSVDARGRAIRVSVSVEVFVDEPVPHEELRFEDRDVSKEKPVIIIGAGPAGLFAALRLIELGRKPIILERGKNVRDRRRDLAALNKEHIVNPDSNYCFGEGGAGTYSDGKLYTRSTKRGDVVRVLELFVAHGADENILVEAHPHIGTNKLPQIITAMRESILRCGGEVHFDTRVSNFIVRDNRVQAVIAQTPEGEKEFPSEAVLLATGHSARDIFELLHKRGLTLERKGFAMGVRVEHPQALIDSIQYHCPIEEVERQREWLPAAAYSLVHQANERGVYSFCMCPGGIIAPCATAPGEIVVNGWSPSKRNNPFANSGIVVAIDPEKDLKSFESAGVFAGLRYQQFLEKLAWKAGGQTQAAPAQALADFMDKKLSAALPDCSYQPGVTSAPLHEILPPAIGKRLREGFQSFGKLMRGYITNEALIVGVESRSSSPIRIPRDKDKLYHPQAVNLFPCGEGAGYAGGIVSAAIDGQRCAEAIAAFS